MTKILTSRQARFWVASAGVCVAMAACGGGGVTAQNDSAPGGSSQSQQAQNNGGSAANPGTTNSNPAAPGTTNSNPAAPGTTNSNPAAPAAPGTAGKSNLPPVPVVPKPGAPNAAPPPGANFASDVGVTASQINIGIINIASANRSLGPPIALASQRMTDAVVRWVNDNGGVAGRRLNLLTCDDGGDVTRARACYEKLKDQVFAFVPSETFR
jgi:hypothetical protein